MIALDLPCESLVPVRSMAGSLGLQPPSFTEVGSVTDELAHTAVEVGWTRQTRAVQRGQHRECRGSTSLLDTSEQVPATGQVPQTQRLHQINACMKGWRTRQ